MAEDLRRMSDDQHIGQRVAYWRRRRGLNRKQFAARVGRSVSWLDKVERGERALARLPVLERIAEALDVHVDVLVKGEDAKEAARAIDATEIKGLREALQRYQAISSVLRPAPNSDDPPDLPALRRQVDYVWTSFQSSRYSIVGRTLPGLLVATQDAVAVYSAHDDEGITARTLLSQSYQVAASTLWKLKEPDLAWLAAERGLNLAEQTGDSLLISDAARRVAHGLMLTQHEDQALELIGLDIDRLEPDSSTGSPEYLSLYGMLFLMGSAVAARSRKAGVVRDLLREGNAVGQRLGSDGNERFTAFGPTNVVLHRVAALVELSEGGAAIEAAREIDPGGLALLPKERRANFRIDLARAHSQSGQTDDATDELWQAFELAPDEVRCRPLVHELLSSLHRQSPTPPFKLRQLAAAVGLQT
jgi:transcriptional regulator with XRE-family HTH domain